MAAATVAGLFDAVLLLALPALLAWTAIGALWAPTAGDVSTHSPAVPAEPARARWLAVAAVVAVVLAAAAGTARSTAQLVSIGLASTREDLASLERAARIDPGNYRLRLRLARSARGTEARCAHAVGARGLFPEAAAARDLSRRCR
jgi:heme A synthase